MTAPRNPTEAAGASGSRTRESVLLPTSQLLRSYACLRSLSRHRIGTIVATERDSIPHSWSRYCDDPVRVPAPEELIAYKDALVDLAARRDVTTIVPVREHDTYVFAKWRDEFADHVSLVTPELETLERSHDRLRLANEAEEAGVPTAKTRLLSDVDEVDEPSVIKSRYNLLTGEYVDLVPSGTVADVNHVEFLLPGDRPNAEAIREVMQHDPIVQEFVPQAEKYLYCGLWDHGEPLATCQHRQIRGTSWMGGGSVYRKSAYSQEVEDVAYDLLSHLDWHGLACIEYLRDERTGEWKFLEINPRIWQSLPAAIRAGADFPYYYWLAARGEPERIDPTYDLDVACHNLYGELSHLMSIRRDESPMSDPPSFSGTLGKIAASCITNPRFDYVRLDDPGFLLGCIRELLARDGGGSRQFERQSASKLIDRSAVAGRSGGGYRPANPIEEAEDADATAGQGHE